MLIVWRLAPPAFSRVLDGEGSREVGGRWNSPGAPVVYTSAHLSLSVLEVYVHIPSALRVEIPDFEAVKIDLPEDATRTIVSSQEFKTLMTSRDPLAACRTIGDQWLSRGTDLVFQAPSVLIPEEANFMLNPSHPRMGEGSIVSTRTFRFDPRLSAPRP